MRSFLLLATALLAVTPTQAHAGGVSIRLPGIIVPPLGTNPAPRADRPKQIDVAHSLPPDRLVAIPKKARMLTINGNPGGIVEVFNQDAVALAANGIKVRINGECASACTRLLVPAYHVDICATPKAVFEFHKPYLTLPARVNGKLRMITQQTPQAQEWSDRGWKTWLSDMSPAFQTYLADKYIPSEARGEHEMVNVPAELAWRLGVPRCDAPQEAFARP